jgi:hypothetical protein
MDASGPDGSPKGVAWVADSEVQGRSVGKRKSWTAELHVGGNPVADADHVYVACWQEPEGNDIFVTIADLCAVSLDSGDVRWRSKLGLGKAKLLDAPWVIRGDGMVYVMLNGVVVALKTTA